MREFADERRPAQSRPRAQPNGPAPGGRSAALAGQAARLHDRRRIAAILILALVFGLIGAGLLARGEEGGADARAYWAAVRVWLNGGDPYHPSGPFLPYVYAPWMLPLFAPWALLPWDVAWFVWRGGVIIAWLATIHWAYRTRPLAIAIAVLVLAFPLGANLDTGNVTMILALGLWVSPVLGRPDRRPDLGPRHLDEVVPGPLLAPPRATGPDLGPALAGDRGPAQPR